MDRTEYDVGMLAHLHRIAQEVFLLMADMELEPCADKPNVGEMVASKLAYRTPAGMELALLCELPVALAATQRLMSLGETPAGVDETVRDSVGEIANMVGGNFHSILSPGMALDATPEVGPVLADGSPVWIESCLRGAHGKVRVVVTGSIGGERAG